MYRGIFKYIFSFTIIFFIFLYCPAQNKDQAEEEKEEEEEDLTFYGIKAGINVGRFSDFLFKPERFSYEGSLDINFGHKYFAVAEAGYSNTNLKKDNYDYYSDGYFIKLGLDYNMLEKYPTDFLGVGFRLGAASFNHSAENVIVENDLWGNIPINIDSESVDTYWLEGSFGLKAELLKNIYFGWSALIKIRLSGGSPSFQPYDIPGYGNGINSINLGANYYIYYQIPYNRNKRK